MKKTTTGYKLHILWRDGSTNWIPLKDMKASNPLETAEFAVARGIHEEPAFAWWVDEVLKTRNRIINKIKSRYWKTEFKFGIELPKNVDDAFRLDEKNGNTFWRTAIEKEMKTVSIAYRPYEHDGENVSPEQIRADRKKHLVGYKEITCHFFYDINLNKSFTRKAYFCANGS